MTTNVNLTTSGATTLVAVNATLPPSRPRRALKNTGWAVLLLITLLGGYILFTNLFWTGLGEGKLAPDFTATDLQGNPVRLSAFQGRPVMLTFWSPECFACRQELPTLQAIANQSKREVVLLTVVSHMTTDAVKTFMQEEKLTFPVIVDEAGALPKLYKVTGVPFTYFIQPDGTIKSTMIGAGAEGDLNKKVNTWVNTCQIDNPCTVKK